MAINNKKHLQVKESQKRITFSEFASIQDSLGMANDQVALLTGLSLSTVESFHGKARQNDLCGAPASTTILMLKFIAEKEPKAFARVKEDFHSWAFAYKA